MTKIISISVSDTDKAMLDDMQLSPSGLMKQKLQEIRENSINYSGKIRNLENSMTFLQSEVQKFYEFIDKKGLFQEFKDFKNE